MTADLSSSLNEAMREAKNVLSARAAAELLAPLGIGRTDSSETSLAKGLGEAIGSLAQGMKGIGELQQMSMKSFLETAMGQKQSENPLMMMLLLKLFEMMEKRGETSNEEPPWLKYVLAVQNDRIEELKAQRGASPIDAQMHELTTQIVSQMAAKAADPFASLRDLAQAKETLSQLGSSLGIGNQSEYSEGALRAKALELEAEKIRLEHHAKLADVQHKREFQQQVLPQVVNNAVDGLGRVLSQFGLVPAPVSGGWSEDLQARVNSEQDQGSVTNDAV